MCVQLDDPLDAIAVHAWNGTWGAIAVRFLAGKSQIQQAYGFLNTDNNCVQDQNDPNSCPLRQWGCWVGGDGHLLGAQIIYLLWLAGACACACVVLRSCPCCSGVGVFLRLCSCLTCLLACSERAK